MSENVPTIDTGEAGPARELRGFLRGFAIVGACFAPVALVNVFVLHRSRSVGGLVGIAIVLGVTLAGRRALARGRVRTALITAIGSLLLASVGFLIVDPGLAPALALMPLLCVALAMPHMGRRTLQLFSLVAIVVSASIVTAGEILPERDDLPAAYLAAMHWSAFIGILALVLWLLVQHRRQLVASLARTKEAEERFRTLVEEMPAVTHISNLDVESSTVYISPQVTELLGYPEARWTEDPGIWSRVLHEDDRKAAIDASRRLVERGEPFAMEYRMVAADGSIVWVQERAVRVEGVDGTPQVLGVWLDVSERVRAEGERHRLEQERRRLISRLVAVQEEERTRIANDIHDDSVQKMAAVGMRLAALRNRLRDPDQVAALDRLEDSVQHAVGRLRHLMFELQPPSLEREGLASTLQQCLVELSDETGVATTLLDELADCDVPMRERAVLFRIAQEGLANARKHARADRIEIRLRALDGGVQLEVHDDGIGFDPDQPPDTLTHIGMRAMRERAQLIGGWVSADSAPGLGTHLRAWIPLPAQRVDGSEAAAAAG